MALSLSHVPTMSGGIRPLTYIQLDLGAIDAAREECEEYIVKQDNGVPDMRAFYHNKAYVDRQFCYYYGRKLFPRHTPYGKLVHPDASSLMIERLWKLTFMLGRPIYSYDHGLSAILLSVSVSLDNPQAINVVLNTGNVWTSVNIP